MLSTTTTTTTNTTTTSTTTTNTTTTQAPDVNQPMGSATQRMVIGCVHNACCFEAHPQIVAIADLSVTGTAEGIE